MRFYSTEWLNDVQPPRLVITEERVGYADALGRVWDHRGEGAAATREDVLRMRGGADALAAWDAGDDSAYQQDAYMGEVRAAHEDLPILVGRGDIEALRLMVEGGSDQELFDCIERDATRRKDADNSA